MPSQRSRRAEHTAESRQALLDSATVLFEQQGYAATALDDIAEAARMTKGALYWHFGSKQALFRATVEALEKALTQRVAERAAAADGPWDAARVAIEEFLDQCCSPTYARVVLRDGLVVLGYAEWHEFMDQYSYGLTRDLLQALIEQGLVDPLPLDAWSRVVIGQLSAAAMLVAEADDFSRQQVREDVEIVLRRTLEGYRRRPTDA